MVTGLGLVVAARVFRAIVCGIGTLPFFVVDDISDRVTVVLWGLAGGITLFASIFGFVVEGLSEAPIAQIGMGLVVGITLVAVADRLIAGYEFQPQEIPDADFRRLVLIVGVLIVQSFPEGVALRVAFADLGADGVLTIVGLANWKIFGWWSFRASRSRLALALPMFS